MKTAVGAVLALFGAISTGAPQVKSEPTRFEVVSIKPCDESVRERDSVRVSPARLRLGCSTAENLILVAYIVYPGGAPLPRGVNVGDALFDAGASVQNGPRWLRSTRFTIEATTKAPARVEEMRGPLMQDLLKERFRVRMHEESRPMAVYELAQDKGGARLKPTQPGSCFEMDATKIPSAPHGGKAPPPICGGYRRSEAGGVDAYHVTIASICRAVSNGLNSRLSTRPDSLAFMMCIWR